MCLGVQSFTWSRTLLATGSGASEKVSGKSTGKGSGRAKGRRAEDRAVDGREGGDQMFRSSPTYKERSAV